MAENRTFPPSKEFSAKAHIKSLAEYEAIYKRSVEDPEGFWGEMAEKNLTWFKKWDKVLDYDFGEAGDQMVFQGGKINVSYNCLDRHINTATTETRPRLYGRRTTGHTRPIPISSCIMEVNRFANVLKNME